MPTTLQIKSGDTLGALAKAHGTTVDAIMAANKGNASVKSANLIIAGGSLNLPDGVGAPASGPAAGTGLPAGGLDPASQAQGAGAQSVGELGNLRIALRSALNEASKNRVASNYQQVAGVTGGVPGTIESVVDMIRGGVKAPVEQTFSDIMKTFEEERKRVEFNPDQFRNVQGGIYDIKENKWVINPKAESGVGDGSKGPKLTRTDVEKLKLPTSLIGTTWLMLRTQIDSSMPPAWFRAKAEQSSQMSLTAGVLGRMWDEFRTSFNDTFAENEDDISFDDF